MSSKQEQILRGRGTCRRASPTDSRAHSRTPTYSISIVRPMGALGFKLGLAGVCMCAFVLAEPTRAAAPPSGDLKCFPRVLYRGDVLNVELPPDHGDLEFAVWTEDLETLVVSFEPRPRDRIGPVIPPDRFAKMKRVELFTTEARGSVSRPWAGAQTPLALAPPKMIFTKTGLYEVLLDGDLGYDDADFAACWVDYNDSLRPRTKTARSPNSRKSLHPSDGAMDVQSAKMTDVQKRAFRRAASRSDAGVIDLGDHFHVAPLHLQ